MASHVGTKVGSAQRLARRLGSGAVLTLPALLAVMLLATGIRANLHPKDGPDVDLRYLVTDEAVRVTMVFNLAFVDELIGISREDPERLDPFEHGGLSDDLFAFVRDDNRVAIDGVQVTPTLVSFEVVDADPKLIPLFPGYGARAITQLQLVVDHPLNSPPRTLDLTWGGFPIEPSWARNGRDPGPMAVSGRLLAGNDEVLMTFTDGEPTFTWQRPDDGGVPQFETVPSADLPPRPRLHVASLIALGAIALTLLFMGPGARRRSAKWALPVAGVLAAALWPALIIELPVATEFTIDDDAAAAVFAPLHANIYRAFDYGAEGDVYDALARSVDGVLLAELYDQVYRGLVMAEHGGALTRVAAVRPLDIEVEQRGALDDGRAGFSVKATWQVDGVVRHWGHTHWRTNEHVARYDVAATAEGWRIVASTMLDQRRVAGSPIEPGPAAAAPSVYELPPGENY